MFIRDKNKTKKADTQILAGWNPLYKNFYDKTYGLYKSLLVITSNLNISNIYFLFFRPFTNNDSRKIANYFYTVGPCTSWPVVWAISHALW